MLAKVCHEHEIDVDPNNPDFRDICADILLSRTELAIEAATETLWDCLNHLDRSDLLPPGEHPIPSRGLSPALDSHGHPALTSLVAAAKQESHSLSTGPEPLHDRPLTAGLQVVSQEQALTAPEHEDLSFLETAHERAIYQYLTHSQGAYLTEIETKLRINRVQAVDALRSLTEKGILVVQRDDLSNRDSAGRTIYRVESLPSAQVS